MIDLEKKSQLYDFTESSFHPLVLELIEELVKSQEMEILRYDVQTGVEKLVHLKCEAQGARKLKTNLESYFKRLRLAASEA